ncbi:Hypothetical protein PENO1_078000 [Penicillium occitanis (nom. inval.)]|nr:Hypothetical protein PENO1_078000 [Penicillium occitanis (nom. inval.)]PCG94828.1 hypothetical protein PENOC_080750 [Penicillium occitanis (nom. inval.)]
MDPSAINTLTEINLNHTELLCLMKKNATRLLDAGVTTACDLGSKGMTAIQVRDGIKEGEVTGPRLQCANAPLTVPKGHAHAMGGVCGGGADLIKVMATGGFNSVGLQTRQENWRLD